MPALAAAAVNPGHDLRVLVTIVPVAGITLAAYGRWILMTVMRGGRVATDQSRLPDLWFTIALGAFFSFIAYLGFSMTEAPALSLSVEGLLIDTALKVFILALFGTFLAVRQVKMITLFGFRALPLGAVLGRGFLFLIAAMPAMFALGVLASYFSAHPEEQQIVSFFRDRAKQGDFGAVVTVFLTASFMAPFTEELLFRGYFYPTLKRYLGPVASALLVSLLFALFHANLPALPALFVLALCLTVAYERTGSLLVPMTMHALFNTSSLAVMYFQATHATP